MASLDFALRPWPAVADQFAFDEPTSMLRLSIPNGDCHLDLPWRAQAFLVLHCNSLRILKCVSFSAAPRGLPERALQRSEDGGFTDLIVGGQCRHGLAGGIASGNLPLLTGIERD